MNSELFEARKQRTFDGGINATFFDVETTGLNFRSDRIIEVCAIKVRKSQPVAMFNSLVYYEGELPAITTKITGHTTADVNGAPLTESCVLTILDTFFGNDTLIAYNGLFDLSFLDSMYRRNDVHEEHYPGTIYDHRYNHLDELGFDLIDPLTIARERSPFPHKLGDMCRKMGIPLDNAHSAYYDTLALLDLVVAMHEEKPIEDYFNFVRYKAKYGEPEWCPAHIKLESDAPTARQANNSTSRGFTQQAKEERKTLNKMLPKVVTKTLKKKIPDPLVDETTLPKSMTLHKLTLNALDAMLDGVVKVGNSELPSICVHVSEFDACMEYLKSKGIPEEHIGSYLDNPEEAIIEYLGE
jgi:DNA polymerase III epsilon subunit-like protein